MAADNSSPLNPAIQALIEETKNRTEAEARTQAMLLQILNEIGLLRDIIKGCNIPGVMQVITQIVSQIEAALGVIIQYISAREQADGNSLREYRDMARKRLEGGGVSVGNINTQGPVQVSGADSLMTILNSQTDDVKRLASEIQEAHAKGQPVKKLIDRMWDLAPSVAETLIKVLPGLLVK